MSGGIFTCPPAWSGRHHAASKHRLFLSSQMFSSMWEGVPLLPGMSDPTLRLCAWTFVPVSLPPLLEDLLCAGGRDVQEPPGCAGVQLLLVPTQRPHIHHPHHLPLHTCGEKTKTVKNSALTLGVTVSHQQTGTRLISPQSNQLVTSCLDPD